MDEKVLFFIKASEQINRPADTLTYLGLYFTWMIKKIDGLKTNKSKASTGQTEFFMTQDVLNHLGTACKNYVDGSR
jgi:hypothetical protein